MVYKCRVTRTQYRVRRGVREYRYIKLIVNLPIDEKLLSTDYVYVLTPDEFRDICKTLCKTICSEHSD